MKHFFEHCTVINVQKQKYNIVNKFLTVRDKKLKISAKSEQLSPLGLKGWTKIQLTEHLL
jgi:hypothetical protein